jgi:hypothetical protein
MAFFQLLPFCLVLHMEIWHHCRNHFLSAFIFYLFVRVPQRNCKNDIKVYSLKEMASLIIFFLRFFTVFHAFWSKFSSHLHSFLNVRLSHEGNKNLDLELYHLDIEYFRKNISFSLASAGQLLVSHQLRSFHQQISPAYKWIHMEPVFFAATFKFSPGR